MARELATSYLGIDLPHPFMPGASPLVDDLDTVRRLEDSGACAIVMHSLFEEQLMAEQLATHRFLEDPADSFPEALSFFPAAEDFALGPEAYLEQIQRIKQAVALPVFASLNGNTRGGWLEFGRLMAQAGADALELNLYELPTDATERGDAIEQRSLAMVREMKELLPVPVAVKLSPFYTSLPHFAHQLDEAGAQGLVIFNRFYQADVNIEGLEVERVLHLSTSQDLLLRLRWLAILYGRQDARLAVSGGVHTPEDAIKAIMCGAHAVQMVSALLKRGPEYLSLLRQGVLDWMEEFEYESLSQMRGSMSLLRCGDPHAYERANYIQILQSWTPSSPTTT